MDTAVRCCPFFYAKNNYYFLKKVAKKFGGLK